jgi:hypothetical protein
MPFYLVFDLALVPLAFTVVWFLRPLFLVSKDAFGAALGLSPLLALHVAVDGGLLYLGAMLLCRLLFWLGSPRVAQLLLAVLVAAGVVASSLPIYAVMAETSGAAHFDVVNASDAWKRFVLGERPPAPRRVR